MAIQPNTWQPPKNEQLGDQPVLGGNVYVPANPEGAARKQREEERDITRTDIAVRSEQRTEEETRLGRFDTYRKEFFANPVVRQFQDVDAATRQIVELAKQESDQPGPGDIALIISYMKALDPGSVVREGEFATAENAGGIPETVRNYYNKVVSGGRLSPELKREFASTATSIYNARRGAYNSYAEVMRGLVQDAGGDPDKQGIRIADEITFEMPGTPGERAAAPGEAFLTERDKELQDKLSQAYASGATLAELQALAQQYGQTIPIASQEELDAARAQGRGIVVTPTGQTTPDPREEMGFIESIGETITGSERSTPEIEALPDWATMPELNSLSVDSFQAALGTMITNPAESVSIIRAQFPGVQVRQDEKGNFILRSSVDGQEYAIKPGFRVSDIPRAIGGIAAFTPAGRATTAGGAALSGGLTQTGIELSQAGTGGEFDAEEVLLASGGNVAGQQIGRGVNAVRNARAARTAAPETVPMQPAPAPAAAEPAAMADELVTPPLAPEVQAEVGAVARQAIGRGKSARDAQAKLAVMAQVDPEAKAAAERLGIELPVDVLSNDARLLTVTGLARSQIGSEAQATWGQTVSQAIQQSDDTLRAIGATRDLGQVSETIRSRLLRGIDTLESDANVLRREVDEAIDVQSRVDAQSLQAQLAQTINDLGGIDEAKQAFSAEEKKLLAMLGDGVGTEKVYRGVGGDTGGGNYYTPDREFARNFTRSGRDSEIKEAFVSTADIYTPPKLPLATREAEIDAAISEARAAGKKAIRVDEGAGEPNSIFVFDKTALMPKGSAVKTPTYARLNQLRDQIGRALFKNQGPWVDAPTATLKRYYGALADDQINHIEAVAGKDIADKMRGSNDLYSQMFKARESMKTVFGKTLEKDIGPLIKTAITTGSKGNGEALRKLMAGVPEDLRPQAILSGIFSLSERQSAQGGFSFAEYAKLYSGLRQNSPIYSQIAKTIGPDSERILRDLYSISKRVAAAEGKIVRTGASNQPLLNALNAEGLLSNVAKGAARRGAVTGGTAVAGGVAGGPVGAVVGGAIADAFQQTATQAGKSNLDRLHGVLVSEPFKDLVDKVATGTVREADINRVANDKAWRRYAKTVLGIQTPAQRKAWLTSAISQAGNTNPEPMTTSTIEVR